MPSSILRVALFAVLAVFYAMAATEHGKRVNTSKARGDQSGYMWDAQNVRSNWEGTNRPILIGERNRMPVYAGLLALFWTPTISNDDFFEKAKVWNIYLSLGLLAALALVLPRYLPPLAATNLTVLVAFGYFIFKAGYVQSELLFYFLLFAAFLLLFDLLTRQAGLKATLLRAVAAGSVAALAHLTKASVPPLVAIFLLAFSIDALARFHAEPHDSLKRLLAGAVLVCAFLGVLSPYIRTNERVFGHYFYNVNTTFYMWYDDWPQASVGTIQHGDGVHWPSMPIEELPGASRYWREHTVGQIAARVGNGLWNMIDRSYYTYSYFKYLVLYLALAAAVAVKRRDAIADAARRRSGLLLFLLLYAAAYVLGIAFYAPVSGTGTSRFLLAHLLPLFFVLSVFFTRDPFRSTEWRVGGASVGLPHFHLLVSALLAFDIAFLIWPRLMTTYGGF